MRVLVLLLLPGCWLEEVTGEPAPLDPAFYEAVEAQQGMPGVGGGDAVPFGAYPGERVTVSGVVVGPTDDPVDLDVRTPDPTVEGGMKGHGKLLLEEPGPFELRVPKALGKLELQAFQDAEADGPTSDDPFAQVLLQVDEIDVTDVTLELVAGARGQGGPQHAPASPGAPGGGPGGGAGGGEDLFAGASGPRVTVRGNIVYDGDGTVDLDVFVPDESTAGGRRHRGKLMRAPGAYELTVPAGFGPLILEAFIDVNQNGPGPGDPMGRYAGNPVVVGDVDLEGIDIVLAVPTDGRMPMGEPAPPPAGGGDLQ